MERPHSTAEQYGRRVALWVRFNQEGFRGRSYNPLVASVAKWRLFAGWLFARSRDKDLNVARSAINRFLEDGGVRRQLLGTSVNAVIKRYRELQYLRGGAAERELNRVPCPEIALRRLVQIGQVAAGRDLFWVCVILVMLLGWFRADTMAGLQPGDVRFAADGSFLVSVRRMKGRPEFRRRPALIQLPPAQSPHPRGVIFAVLRRLLGRHPDALAEGLGLAFRGQSEAAAAGRITAEFRRLVPAVVLNLPAGAVVSSHSFREMGATTAVKARYSPALACDHGLWRDFSTLQSHYYFQEFPFSAWLAAVFDFLATR
jgi:hypothetical protein